MNNHYDNETLMLFLYEELPVNEQQDIKEHLSGCRACQQQLTLLQETLRFYQRVPQEVPRPEILSSLLAPKEVVMPRKSTVKKMYESPLAIRPPARWAIIAFSGILFVASLIIFFKDFSQQPLPTQLPESTLSISLWHSPTAFLLRSSGEALVTTVPQLGVAPYEFKITMPDKMN